MFSRQGWQSGNTVEMALGTDMHTQHGRAVFVTRCLRYAAYTLLLTALLLAAVHFTIQVI